MNTDNAVKSAGAFFLIILVGTLVASLAGGAFGSLVATVSPEFVRELFNRCPGSEIVRYAFAVGMIWGVFIGAGVSSFACFIAAVTKILRIRFEFQKDRAAGQSPDSSR